FFASKSADKSSHSKQNLSSCLQYCLQTIKILFICRFNDVPDALRNCRVLKLVHPVNPGSTFVGLQAYRENEMRRRDVLDDDRGWRIHFQKDAFVRMVRAVRPVHHELPMSAGRELKNFEGVGESVRSPPTCQDFGPGEGVKNNLARIRHEAMRDKGSSV